MAALSQIFNSAVIVMPFTELHSRTTYKNMSLLDLAKLVISWPIASLTDSKDILCELLIKAVSFLKKICHTL